MSYRFSRPFTAEDIADFGRCRYWFYLDQVRPRASRRVPARFLFNEAIKIAVMRIHRGRFRHSNMEALLDRIYQFLRRREERKVVYQASVKKEYGWFLTEGGKVLRNYSAAKHNRGCELQAVSEPWEVEICGFPFQGKFDQVRMYDGKTFLLELDWREILPTATSLRLNFGNAIRAAAFHRIHGGLPDYVGVYNLYEHKVYSRPMPLEPLHERDATLQYARWYHDDPPVSLKVIREITGNNKLHAAGKVYFPEGHQIGPGLNAVRMPGSGVEWMLRSVKRICEEISAGNRFYINPGYCFKCPHRDRCRGKVEMYEKVEMSGE